MLVIELHLKVLIFLNNFKLKKSNGQLILDNLNKIANNITSYLFSNSDQIISMNTRLEIEDYLDSLGVIDSQWLDIIFNHKNFNYIAPNNLIEKLSNMPTKNIGIICMEGKKSRELIKILKVPEYSSFDGGFKSLFKSINIHTFDAKNSNYNQRQALVIGNKKQMAIEKARIAIVGCGGLGSQVISILSANNLREIHLIDGDIIELTNLNRQTIYKESDVGSLKVEAAGKFIHERSPSTVVRTISKKFHEKDLMHDFDLIVDCTDNLSSRTQIVKAAKKQKIDYVTGSVIRNEGYIFSGSHTLDAPCLQCFFEDSDSSSLDQCRSVGVTSTSVAIIGSLMCAEILKALTNHTQVKNSLIYFDAWNTRMTKINIKKSLRCPACN